MAIRRETVTVITGTQGAGAALGSGKTTQVVHGRVKAVYFDADAAAPVTTKFVVAEAGNLPALPVLSVTGVNTDQWYFPMQQAALASSGAALANVGIDVVCADHLSVAITLANNTQTFAVTIVWDDMRES